MLRAYLAGAIATAGMQRAAVAAVASKKRVLFLRHGQTAHNIPPYTAVLNTDNELTPAGEQQAAEVNLQLKQLSAGGWLHLDAVVVSPLTRSIQTGLIATEGLDVPVVLTREHALPVWRPSCLAAGPTA